MFCRANAQQPKLFVGMILILIFAEALALYGLIGEPLKDLSCMHPTEVPFTERHLHSSVPTLPVTK